MFKPAYDAPRMRIVFAIVLVLKDQLVRKSFFRIKSVFVESAKRNLQSMLKLYLFLQSRAKLIRERKLGSFLGD